MEYMLNVRDHVDYLLLFIFITKLSNKNYFFINTINCDDRTIVLGYRPEGINNDLTLIARFHNESKNINIQISLSFDTFSFYKMTSDEKDRIITNLNNKLIKSNLSGMFNAKQAGSFNIYGTDILYNITFATNENSFDIYTDSIQMILCTVYNIYIDILCINSRP